MQSREPSKSDDDIVAERFEKWHDDAVLFVKEVFSATPDAWQKDVLRAVVTDPRVAMSACKGPGKSCVLAWVIWWFLTTRYNSQIMVLSITKDNLRDNLWKELASWYAIGEQTLYDLFEFDAVRISSKSNPKTWWCSARSFPKQADQDQQANTLAGFHNYHIMIVMDEVSDYPHGVMSAAEAIFANPVDAHIVCAGNPTNIDGPLGRITTTDADLWHITYITGDPDDPKRSPRISLSWAQQQIEKYGRDDPWVKTNILGEFPPRGSDKLIGPNEVIGAMQRDAPYLAFRNDPIIWGLDPGRFGDDESSLARRQGLVARRFLTWRNLDGPKLASALSKEIHEAERQGEKPQVIFMDVGGIGSSAFDQMIVLGWEDMVIPVDFGSQAGDPGRYANKRTEMWMLMAEWIQKKPSCLPNDPVLQSELTAPKYDYREVVKKTVYILESKKEMKKRGVQSPNRADSLSLTFAEPVAPRDPYVQQDNYGVTKAITSYDPLGA